MASAAVADGSSGTTRIELSIQGMTCAACAARVERKLSRLDGVQAAVNFATERASITAPAGVSVPMLIAAGAQPGQGGEPGGLAEVPGLGAGCGKLWIQFAEHDSPDSFVPVNPA